MRRTTGAPRKHVTRICIYMYAYTPHVYVPSDAHPCEVTIQKQLRSLNNRPHYNLQSHSCGDDDGKRNVAVTKVVDGTSRKCARIICTQLDKNKV